ncbi:hypothetical protein RUM44_011688 [Polyplax serrata]|uniref:RING-type domain-containing protein n=1 Tax=Polyplax serrata TaxID=468196 RepID=A0ABR1AR06_POLSC
MDWVHCNHCYVQPGDVEMKKFYITNCGHTYCNECLQMNKSKECRVCHIKYTTIPLTSDMNSEVEIYFHDPVKNLRKIIKILEFQQGHRIRLASFNRDKMRAYKSMKKENHNLKEELDLFKEENMKLRNEMKILKDEVLQYKKKCEFPGSSDQAISSQSITTPRMHSYAQFLAKEVQRTTPRIASKNLYVNNDENINSTTKTPSSDFFILSDSKSSGRDRRFTTPDIPRFPDGYR